MEIIDIRNRPELREVAEQVRRTGRPAVLQEAGEPIATIAPAKPVKHGAGARGSRHLTADDPLWKIVGLDKSTEGPTDVSSNKHKYLAGAYLHEPE